MVTTQQFVTTTSILTFGGASLAVFLISAAVQRVIAKNWIVIPFIAAIVVGFGIAKTAGTLDTFLDWLVAFVNCCLLFCTATGANELAAARPAGTTKPQ